MKRIVKTNSEKFYNYVKKELLKLGFIENSNSFSHGNITAKIDCFDTVVYSVFLKFGSPFPKFANNQFSGKHNFHSGSNIRMAIVEFNIYFEEVKNYTKGKK